jgi:GT2 family glycosyltransferase
MNREAFLQLGGYNAQLVHQGEEHDLSARALKRNLVCLQYPDALIHHMESNEGRNWDRMDFFGSRNAVLWNDWYVPDAAQFGSRARRVAATVVHCVSTRRLGQVRGHWASLGARSTMTSFRDRLSPAQYAHWLSLPFA